MQDIIKQFTNKHHDIKIYIDYGAFDNLDVYIDSHTPYDHLILFRKSDPAYIGDVNYLSVTPYPNNTVDVEFQGVTYRYFEFTNENQFIIFIDMKTGEFLSLGNPKRSEILEALNRHSIIYDALKFLTSEKEKGLDYLNATYPWLGFFTDGTQNQYFNIWSKGDRYGTIHGGYFMQYPTSGTWEIDCDLDKSTINALKRCLKHKGS
jgi:hypothetical protein